MPASSYSGGACRPSPHEAAGALKHEADMKIGQQARDQVTQRRVLVIGGGKVFAFVRTLTGEVYCRKWERLRPAYGWSDRDCEELEMVRCK